MFVLSNERNAGKSTGDKKWDNFFKGFCLQNSKPG